MHEDVTVECGIPTEPSVFPPVDTVSVNLGSDSYSAFELDERKYLDYERAVQQFLTSRQSVDDVPDVFVVAVVGCGRGPLVSCVLNAAENCCAAVRIYALEKNPIAFATLQEKVNSVWQSFNIRLVMADMRHWDAPEQFDIILSEMLGSFGDNELCPEMLTGPERFLKPDGACIPQSYTSYLSPISVPKVYELLSGQDEDATEQMRQMIYGYTADSSHILADPQPVFTFQHPSTTAGEESSVKSVELQFEIKRAGVLYGFGGYFEATLYAEIEHSLLPDRLTPGLCSWNDIFFPLKRPVYVREREVVILQFYRCRSEEFVWYEWAVVKPFMSGRHNSNGKACRMSLQLSEPKIS